MKLLTVVQLCELLQVKRDWVYDKVRKNEIPHVRIGQLIRFRQEDIDAWVAKSMVSK